MIPRFTAIITHRLTHDVTVSTVHTLGSLDELDDIVSEGPSVEALKDIVITYNFDRGVTLAEIEPKRDLPTEATLEEEQPLVH